VIPELFLRFLLISLLAFGGGQAALPLVEQVAVQQMRWVSASTFGAAVAFSYLTPGPVLIVAAFIGVQVAGAAGALAATAGAFLAPWLLAGVAARQVGRFASHPLLRDFGAGAGPAVAGLLGLTVVDLTRSAGSTWAFVVIALGAALLALRPRVHPLFLLAAGAMLGWLLGL
jgi:chromate transporter